jgi:hypothetical protein
MIRPHEIIKIVADLQEQDALELAYQMAGHYMDRLESGELRFNHLSLLSFAHRHP